MKVQSSENKLVITEEFIFDQNKLPSDPNNHFKRRLHKLAWIYTCQNAMLLEITCRSSYMFNQDKYHLYPYIYIQLLRHFLMPHWGTIWLIISFRKINKQTYQKKGRERSGSVVEYLTQDREAAGSSLTGVTALWSLSKTHLS